MQGLHICFQFIIIFFFNSELNSSLYYYNNILYKGWSK